MTSDPFTYHFIPPRLRDLDAETGDLLAISLFEEDRPPPGLTGLVDWRIDGLISHIRAITLRPDMANPHYRGLALGPFQAAENEKLLFPGGNHLHFGKVLVLGLGSRKTYSNQKYRNAVTALLQAAVSMKAETLALQLPGWLTAGVPARRACDIFITELASMRRRGLILPRQLCFVEHLDYQGEMDERVIEFLDGKG
jgi:hypothetical protein